MKKLLALSLMTVLVALCVVPGVQAGGGDARVAALASRIAGASDLAIAQLDVYITGDAVDFLGGKAQKDQVCRLGETYLLTVEGLLREASSSIPEKVLSPLVAQVKSVRNSLSYLGLLDETPDDIYKMVVDHQKAIGTIEKCAASLVP